MFVVLLKFSENKGLAQQYMAGHKEWIDAGFNDGVFALVGGLQPNAGGGILAINTTRDALEERVRRDPFVEHGIVTPDIIEIAPARTNGQLAWLTQ
ncbi:hypothetical protein ASD15_11485 [Massilia sp. Root351]|jgi:uncharacterized protein YciI|uniref:YciI family protein n=1 Tax=Massilia sp. Root351 TaxID=1736522 RepID=UPI00070E6BA9|nr:hypothetical protein [Massilia sp. Root351]KQV82604.1 hypothetical protein ASD15_11485 [Massilia sp. Root351]